MCSVSVIVCSEGFSEVIYALLQKWLTNGQFVYSLPKLCAAFSYVLYLSEKTKTPYGAVHQGLICGKIGACCGN
jgi:hypothetical protein